MGTNSTRLLVADVVEGRVEQRERRTKITRLGEGVEATGRLSDDAIERVLTACAEYSRAIERHGVERAVAVLTSAVRDAANGAQLERAVRERFGFEAETISGEQEAMLTYRGATGARPHRTPLVVLDIGGGSTELVVGEGEEILFHVSTQLGSIRHTERILTSDPPTEEQLERCRIEVRAELERAVPAEVRRSVVEGVAVAGTPTSFAAIEQRLEPYDPDRVDGYRLALEGCESILAELASLPLSERRGVTGLHPERAPAIVAGGIILVETMRAFELDSIEVSEHDILDGVALEVAENKPQFGLK
jgi:exopolyphosphatase / guanosine-5'-triphosphate,3'-diphosphate pyrophosphatase